MKGNPLSKIQLAVISAVSITMSGANAADIDVITDQTSVNTTYGVRTLTSNETWTKDNTYFMTDRVYVPAGITLTIEAGTEVYSTFNDNSTPADPADDAVGALIVARGAQLIANGTAAEPILFSALAAWEAENSADSPFDADTAVSAAPTVDTRQQWGGIVVLGNAYIAVTDASGVNVGNKEIEGFAPGAVTGADGLIDILEYGFDADFPRDDGDNSGSLSYISIRHGGYEFGSGNEINGLTLGGVGSGTTINHIEVVSNFDDGVEFFGGTVNTNNIAVAFCGDDSYDIDEGHSGTHQFWFAIQNPNTGDNLGEWDGVNGSDKDSLDPSVTRSNPQIYNVTFVGPGQTNTNSNTAKDNAIFMDDFFSGAVFNSILTDSVNFLTSFSSDFTGSVVGGVNLTFENNTIGNFGRLNSTIFVDNASILNNAASAADYYVNSVGNTIDGNTNANTAAGFTTYTRDVTSGNLTAIDPRPAAGSSALTGALSAGAPVTTTYRGAFGPSNNWLSGWSFLSEQNLLVSNSVDGDGDRIADALELELGLDPALQNTASEIETAVNARITAIENSFISLGGVEATIDISSGNAVIGFDLKETTTFGASSFSVTNSFDVGLPAGKKFYRFETAE